MNSKYFLLLLLGVYLLHACDDGFLETGVMPIGEMEEAQVEYPLKYVYTGVDFQPTDFYTYQVDSFEQIFITEGQYVLIDSFIFAEIFDAENKEEGLGEEWPFKEIELLNDTLLRMLIEIEDNALDTNFNYRVEDDLLIIDFYGGEPTFEILEDSKGIRFCWQTWGFNYFNENRETREFGFIDSGDCETDNVEELLFSIVKGLEETRYKIQQQDTLMINISYYVLDLE